MQIIDACALINILNCSVWEIFGIHFSKDICFQGLVEDECSSVQDKLEYLVNRGSLIKFDGSLVTAKEVAEMATSFAIGMGESECLAIAKKFNYSFISDDKRARNAARQAIPEALTTGSIGMLCTLVDSGRISRNAAEQALVEIRARGGHVPSFNFETRQPR
jgi:predicted nucleic acid-binding protein